MHFIAKTMTARVKRSFTLLALTVIASAPQTALAHHPIDFKTPDSAWTGLASGVAHPVISLSQALLLLGIACLIALGRSTSKTFVGKLAYGGIFALASLTGVVVHFLIPSLLSVVWPDLILALAAFGLGAFLFVRLPKQILGLVIFFAFAGGAILSESIIGAEPTPLVFYLLGIAITQSLTIGIVSWFIAGLVKADNSFGQKARFTSGALVVASGLFLMIAL